MLNRFKCDVPTRWFTHLIQQYLLPYLCWDHLTACYYFRAQSIPWHFSSSFHFTSATFISHFDRFSYIEMRHVNVFVVWWSLIFRVMFLLWGGQQKGDYHQSALIFLEYSDLWNSMFEAAEFRLRIQNPFVRVAFQHIETFS